MSSTNQPRIEQVAELTRGITLPLPAISNRVMEILVETLVRAWEALASEHEQTLSAGEEVEINTLMESRLRTFIVEDQLWGTLVSSVDRGIESMNFDGSRLELRPDLSILLTRRDPRFRLVAECKLIDHPNGKTVDLYCSKGLHRFIAGDYAWGVRESLMLAYVRDGSTIEDHLRSHLSDKQQKNPDPYLTINLPISHDDMDVLADSSHARSFDYIHTTSTSSPGPISIWHLWLPLKKPPTKSQLQDGVPLEEPLAIG